MTRRNPIALAIGLVIIRARIPFPNEKQAWQRIQDFNEAPYSLYLAHGLI